MFGIKKIENKINKDQRKVSTKICFLTLLILIFMGSVYSFAVSGPNLIWEQIWAFKGYPYYSTLIVGIEEIKDHASAISNFAVNRTMRGINWAGGGSVLSSTVEIWYPIYNPYYGYSSYGYSGTVGSPFNSTFSAIKAVPYPYPFQPFPGKDSVAVCQNSATVTTFNRLKLYTFGFGVSNWDYNTVNPNSLTIACSSIKVIDDRDGDGVHDLIVDSQPSVPGAISALIMVSGLTGLELARYDLPSNISIASITDVSDQNGDGTPEIAVQQNTSGNPSPATIAILDGSNLSFISSWQGPFGPNSVTVTGATIVGLKALVTGGHHAFSKYRESDGHLLWRKGRPCTEFDRVSELDGVGDVNGDGYEDFIVTSHTDTQDPSCLGLPNIYSIAIVNGSNGRFFGHYDGLESLPSVNGISTISDHSSPPDGVPDIIVATGGYNYVSLDSRTCQVLSIISTTDKNQNAAVAGNLDLDLDGVRGDFIAGFHNRLQFYTN